MPARKCLTGIVFGNYKVTGDALDEVDPKGRRKRRVIAQCMCGSPPKAIRSECLTSGHTKSCGCLQPKAASLANKTHGMSRTSTYSIWVDMRERCTNPNNKSFSDYGGRGIKVCERWAEFESFFKDMGERPRGMTLDRWPDKHGNYEPKNCRWATRKQQNRNKTNNLVYTVRGITATLVELVEHFKRDYMLVYRRLVLGWPPERAFFEKRHKKGSRAG